MTRWTLCLTHIKTNLRCPETSSYFILETAVTQIPLKYSTFSFTRMQTQLSLPPVHGGESGVAAGRRRR